VSVNKYVELMESQLELALREIGVPLKEHCVQTGSVAHPASYPMGTRVSFPGGKAAGTRSRPLTSI